jgi:hypothetical protein
MHVAIKHHKAKGVLRIAATDLYQAGATCNYHK